LLRQLRNEQGYLLIEVLIASIILSVGIVAMLQSLGRAVEVARYSRNHAVALTLLEDNITQLEAETSGYDLDLGQDSLSIAAGFDLGFETVADDSGLGATRVTVRWKERGRNARCDAAPLLITVGIHGEMGRSQTTGEGGSTAGRGEPDDQ
jgi:type II secretory pathway pseudopilin PulG